MSVEKYEKDEQIKKVRPMNTSREESDRDSQLHFMERIERLFKTNRHKPCFTQKGNSVRIYAVT